ncbi:molecular chaperone DnaJ [Mycoplasmoides genitalium M6320]|uniref:Chaperone protein DnaJ n=1 Tax=Mycoplasmoides genitalium M6320 TaxID=662945 RepID=A0ABC7ZID5_MYCGT|nr:molecular chaperone DnaJ [Mycoplasmoides genitalium]AFQ03811.1 molecular chaperone DnaJ [Mycoplasmoides genitalium M6320]
MAAGKRDYYEVLGISKNASSQDIKRAFRKLAMQYHPDRHKAENETTQKQNEEKFKEVNEAYEVLSDEEKRKLYDQFGHEGLNASGFHEAGFNPFDIFNSVFGEGFSFGMDGDSPFDFIFNRSKKRQQQIVVPYNLDIALVIEINFFEMTNGCNKTIEYERKVSCHNCNGFGAEGGESGLDLCKDCNGNGFVIKNQRSIFGTIQSQVLCSTCNGQGKQIKVKCKTCRSNKYTVTNQIKEINIPAGMYSGEALVDESGGNEFKGHYGKLIIQVNVLASKIFKRSDNNVIANVLVDPMVAIVGGVIELPTLEGIKEFNIRPGTKSGEQIVIPNGGIKFSKSFKRKAGDLIIIISYARPCEYTNLELKKLREFIKPNQEVKQYLNTLKNEYKT